MIFKKPLIAEGPDNEQSESVTGHPIGAWLSKKVLSIRILVHVFRPYVKIVGASALAMTAF